ncbi:MarR family transcriptional regulator [Moellerella wisconsensis]|uniref:MarR family transcriptional regulator n=1 Tax=Moellerella wisconsensis TaxID=158849 RepID=UPI001F4DBD5E|nr:MarR family transcriptional regulator [Moellerella wisconsensis]UNH25057.1 MarR family transcriptional regulator [Moellerella wisconsensis]
MKGTTSTALMWIYAAERMSRKLKYVKSGRGKVDYNLKLYKPYRSERVLYCLMKLDAGVFFKSIKSSQQEASNAGN